MQALLPLLKTFLYSAIGSVVVPWISSKLGVQITPDQTTTLQNVAFGGLIGVGSAAVHWLHQKFLPGATPPASSPPPAAKASAHWLMTVIASALAVLTLVGCASLTSFFSSPTGNVVVTAAVDVAVSTAEQKGISAAQINAVAKQALAADSGVTATASAISGVLNAQVAKLNLPAGDLAAIDVLETAFAAALVAKIGSNTSVASAQADIATLLNQVIADTGG